MRLWTRNILGNFPRNLVKFNSECDFSFYWPVIFFLFELKCYFTFNNPTAWMMDPCGVVGDYSPASSFNQSLSKMDQTPLLLQLMVTLSRVNNWIEDFVSQNF